MALWDYKTVLSREDVGSNLSKDLTLLDETIEIGSKRAKKGVIYDPPHLIV